MTFSNLIIMIIGSRIIFYNTLTSTNTYAIRLAGSEKPEEGTIIHAAFQTAGRGQPGNKWISDEGKNLLFSIILYPSAIRPHEQFVVSMAISLGIRDHIARFTDSCMIKWPNDIYVKNDKIAGILIESSLMEERLEYMVVGIGLNVNQDMFPGEAANATSLKRITGKFYDTHKLLESLAEDLDRRYDQVKTGRTAGIKKEYLSALYRNNEWAMFSDADGAFTAKITDVDKSGRMTLKTEAGRKKKYWFREVDFIP